MDSIVILSPHFDDSILSCGGRIWQAREAGQAVRVLTLFAGPPGAKLPPFARVQHGMWGDPPDANRLRRAEDQAAHARLGCCDLYHLDAPDAVYRVGVAGHPLYDSEAAIFGAIQQEEQGYARALTDLAHAYLPAESTILAPLGVGHHVDHQVAHAVGHHLVEDGWQVAFYEELPYVERSGALERALAGKEGWRVEATPLPAAALAAKVAAMAYYHTQLPVLYGDAATMAARLHAVATAAAVGAGYAERIWWPNVRA